MPAQLFLPTARQINWLLIIGFLALGQALYLRYQVVENSQLAFACQTGLNTWTCWTRKLVLFLFMHAVFGWSAVIAAVLNLVRPSLVLLCFGIAATACGLVLHNAGLSGLAAALLMLSLARPAPAPE
jgi:hypothetical protein